jgi:hypothetical protein
MIENNFVPYEQALALKELGFDEPCFAYYNNKAKIIFNTNGQPVIKDWIWVKNEIIPTDMVLAPLYQQAFSFFRKKFLLEGIVEQAYDFYWYKFSVYFYNKEGKQKISNGLEFLTYEEAELACLNNLIKIVKNENKIQSNMGRRSSTSQPL